MYNETNISLSCYLFRLLSRRRYSHLLTEMVNKKKEEEVHRSESTAYIVADLPGQRDETHALI